MSIADYAALLVDAGEYSGRNDIAHLFPRFVGLAELKLNRALRVSEMEATVAISIIDGDAPLPADFLEARQVLTASGRPIRAMALQQLAASVPAGASAPLGYAVVGNRIRAFPPGSYGLTLTYYTRTHRFRPQARPTGCSRRRRMSISMGSSRRSPSGSATRARPGPHSN